MRKLIIQVQTSIDGFVAEKNGKTDWAVWNWSHEWTWDAKLRKYHNDLTASIDCILMGRKMAEGGFYDHWIEISKWHTNPQAGFANKLNEVHKVVFTKTLKESKWDNTEIANGDLATEINKLKNASGKNIIAYGGATFISSIIKAGLFDELHLVINPVAIGTGLPIFDKLNGYLPLSLIKSTSFACGVVVSKYKKR